jgi:hypothetical protein
MAVGGASAGSRVGVPLVESKEKARFFQMMLFCRTGLENTASAFTFGGGFGPKAAARRGLLSSELMPAG